MEFIAELPPEYIDHIIADHECVIEVLKPVEISSRLRGWELRRLEIENVTIGIHNKYYTTIIREALIKQKIKTNAT